MVTKRSKFLGSGLATLAITASGFAAPVIAADAPKMEKLTLSKECSQYSGGLPSFCTVLNSNLPALKAGTKVLYYGPVTSNPAFSSNNVVLDTGDGGTAIDSHKCIHKLAHWRNIVATRWQSNDEAAVINVIAISDNQAACAPDGIVEAKDKA